MGYYLTLILIPAFIVVLCAKWLFPHKITMKEWGLQFLGLILSTGLCAGIIGIVSFSNTYDTEILNGYVTSKQSVHVSCDHMYQCGQSCSTDGKGNTSCVPIYCPEHAYDVDWDVHTTVGTFTIDRVDRQGLHEPKRFTDVNIGEFAATSSYTKNYLLIDKGRFDTDEAIVKKYEGKVPKYPDTFDYYRFNRVVNTTDRSFNYLNVFLNNNLREMGARKQLNIIVVVTEYSNDFYNALYKEWNGGKKNDVILVYGIDSSNNIKWFRATSFADGQDNRELLARLRLETHDQQLSLNLVQKQLSIIDKNFTRLPNETFSYIDSFQDTSIGLILLCMFFNILTSIGIAYYMYKEDVA